MGTIVVAVIAGIVVLVLVLVAGVAIVATIAQRGRPRPTPADPSWLWEGIRLEPAAISAGTTGDRPGEVRFLGRPRLVIRGEYMARPSIYRAASSDWAFTNHATPILVLFDVSRGVEIHRASLDRIGGEYRALVRGLSISYAMPPPPLPVSDDGNRREGAPFAVDIGFYLEPRDEPWELRVHAELGPLRSEPIAIAVPAAGAPPREVT